MERYKINSSVESAIAYERGMIEYASSKLPFYAQRGNVNMTEVLEAQIRRRQALIDRLGGGEPSGLSKNDVEYGDNYEVCHNCESFYEKASLCDLLKDGENDTKAYNTCNFWKEKEYD
jgi:hypothetical protein